jgi:hypothetical protein
MCTELRKPVEKKQEEEEDKLPKYCSLKKHVLVMLMCFVGASLIEFTMTPTMMTTRCYVSRLYVWAYLVIVAVAKFALSISA